MAPSPSAQPSVSTACHLGWDNNGTFLPDTTATIRALRTDGGGGAAMQVTLTNTSGTGINIGSFTVEATYQGTVIGQPSTIYGADLTQGSLPVFLAPGETETYLIDASSQSGTVIVSTRTYLASVCSVTQYYS